MKLILTREVPNLGGAGDVVTVKDGYGRNFLLSRGAAILWTKGGEGQIEGIKRARTTREIRDLDHAKEIKTKLEKANVIVKVKIGSTGTMFGSVTDKAIVAAIKSATGETVDRHKIKMDKHIKKVGKYTVKIALESQIVANVPISVVSDK
ncbi:MAG: 50S ribosomal protein L9 [Actinobacteria bacterium]|jgi:large subunit ribosomal protein L9|nr:50S ribosomal protein L9 [Actinomycetota bacterium]